MKILVVDDELNIRLLLQEIFNLKGYDTTLAENGEQALSMIRNQQYDIVFLDRKMPVLSGEATLNQIRTFSDIPVYLISAFQTDEEVQTIKSKGATGVLMKPFTIDEVLNIAQKYA
ncbi:response regulator [Macrococcus capreoli]|uniref:response regulator n=1 Tax=Macrococcus capreoli TaxID=2982690 RepID=UPI0021D595B0|nr:response regulator [Macrococcus sp. TMW 2.2395]MCU7558126.1 response regulator [Macrococcus sp. TMW 2.2395]